VLRKETGWTGRCAVPRNFRIETGIAPVPSRRSSLDMNMCLYPSRWPFPASCKPSTTVSYALEIRCEVCSACLLVVVLPWSVMMAISHADLLYICICTAMQTDCVCCFSYESPSKHTTPGPGQPGTPADIRTTAARFHPCNMQHFST
jgi:hypothetical protein